MEEKNWSQKLAEQRAMRVKGAEMVWERTKLLIAVYEDDEFLAHCEYIEKDPIAVLDEELADTCATFTALRLVLKKFPAKQQWKEKRLDQLVVATLDDRKNKDTDRETRPTWKEKYQELERKYNMLLRQHEILEARFEEVTRMAKA